jgi:hypothetical protein
MTENEEHITFSIDGGDWQTISHLGQYIEEDEAIYFTVSGITFYTAREDRAARFAERCLWDD